jgi:microcystin-dependent protein
MSETGFLTKRENFDAFCVHVSFLLLAMDNSKQEKLDLNMYGQVWSSSDLNPDRLTSELNKIFTYNQAETNYRNTSDKYYDFHEEYAKSLAVSAAFKGSADILGIASASMDISASLNKAESGATGKTTHDVITLADIKQYLDQKSIETEWNGEKIIPKSFQVYKLTDITDNLQVTLMATELTAEKTKNAMIRTLSTLNLPPTFGGLTQTSVIQSSTCMIGEIRLYSANSHPPFPWLFCNGTAISRIEYPRLFSVIGESFGAGDGKLTFNVPDFRDRFPLGFNPMGSQVDNWKKGGNKEQTLTIEQMPTHHHSAGTLHTKNAGTHKHTVNDPGHNHGGYTVHQNIPRPHRFNYKNDDTLDDYNYNFDHTAAHQHVIPVGKTGITLDNDGTHSHSIQGSTGSVGSGNSFSIMPPYQTIAYIIFTGANCA